MKRSIKNIVGFSGSRALVLTMALVSFASQLWAQVGHDLDTFTVKSNYEAHIADAVKINFEAQPPSIKQDSANFKYDIPLRFLSINYPVPTIRPLAMPKEKQPEYLNSYVKLGFGNRTTPLIEAAFNDGNHPRNDNAFKINYGARYHHLSSNGPQFQDFSDNDFHAYTDLYPRAVKLSAWFDYDRHAVNYYGIDPTLESVISKDSMKQYFTRYGYNVSLENAKKNDAKIDYKYLFHLGSLKDHFDNKENDVLTSFVLTKKFKNSHYFDLNFTEDYSKLNFSASPADNIFSITPKYTFNTETWFISGGLNGTWNRGAFYVFPDLYLQRELVKNYLIFYSGWKRWMQKNSYATLTQQNPFISDSISFLNSRIEDRFIGIKGTILRNLTYNFKFSQKFVKNLPLFVNEYDYDNSPIDTAKFNIIYNNTTTISNVHAELAYNVNERLRFTLLADYFIYEMGNPLIARPWHMPTTQVNFNASYNIGNKIILSADVFAINGAYALLKDGTEYKIKGAIDANVNIQYVYNKNLSLFCSLNNIANQKYERWYKYPTYGFTGIGGLMFTF